jgi:hypothetical protein
MLSAREEAAQAEAARARQAAAAELMHHWGAVKGKPGVMSPLHLALKLQKFGVTDDQLAAAGFDDHHVRAVYGLQQEAAGLKPFTVAKTIPATAVRKLEQIGNSIAGAPNPAAKDDWEFIIREFDGFFLTGKNAPNRSSFTRAVGLVAKAFPEQLGDLASAIGTSPDMLVGAAKGIKLNLHGEQRRHAAARYACEQAAGVGATIPATLAQKIKFQPAHAA